MDRLDIWFVNLGIKLFNHQKGITIGGFTITFYGMMIAIAVLAGLALASHLAKKSGMDPDVLVDMAIYAVIFGIVGARIYYVVFAWDLYKNDPVQVFNLRGGGLAIYGGVIGATIAVLVYSRVKKIAFGKLADLACCGLVLGQIIGRWGNFFNCEAFGGYTDNLFAMRLNVDLVNSSMISEELMEHLTTVDGISYIQVHPTFLYEGVWNFCLLLFLLWFRKRTRFDGEVFCAYLCGYGVGRFLIEGLRTDQLKFFGTSLAVSQMLSAVLVVLSLTVILLRQKTLKKKRK